MALKKEASGHPLPRPLMRSMSMKMKEQWKDCRTILKRSSGDIHEELESHNRMLDRMVLDTMGDNMDSSRGILSGTMDRFKTVFETRRMFTLRGPFPSCILPNQVRYRATVSVALD